MKLIITCESTASDYDFSAELQTIAAQLEEGFTNGADTNDNSSYIYHVVE